MSTITPVCPACGSREFRSNDHVLCSTDIAEMTLQPDGTFSIEYSTCGSETYDDTTEPVNPEKPYECAECQHPMSEVDLIACHAAEVEEEEEGE
jgi:hypothetical protein